MYACVPENGGGFFEVVCRLEDRPAFLATLPHTTIRECLYASTPSLSKAQTDFFKHMSTLSAATVVAVLALIEGLIKNPDMIYLYGTMGLLVAAVFLSFWDFSGPANS